MSTTPPIRLVVPSDATVNLAHATTARASIPVSDTGSLPLRVTASVADLTRSARQFPGLSWVRSVTPRTLLLQPGQQGHFVLQLQVPAGVRGTHFVNFIARAVPAGLRGSAASRVSAGVGGTLKLVNPGRVAALPVGHLAPHYLPPAGNSHAVWVVVVLAAVVLVAGLAVAGAWRWLRHRRALAAAEMSGRYPSYDHEQGQPARHRSR